MEWCYDFYAKYPEDKVINPIGPLHGKKRVLRGREVFTEPLSNVGQLTERVLIPLGVDQKLGLG